MSEYTNNYGDVIRQKLKEDDELRKNVEEQMKELDKDQDFYDAKMQELEDKYLELKDELSKRLMEDINGEVSEPDWNISLEEGVESFLKWTGYNDWKDNFFDVYAQLRSRIDGCSTYSLGVIAFENLEKDLLRHKKEREEDDKKLTLRNHASSPEWFKDSGWVACYRERKISKIEADIAGRRVTIYDEKPEILYVDGYPLPFLINTVGQLKQIISILEESDE